MGAEVEGTGACAFGGGVRRTAEAARFRKRGVCADSRRDANTRQLPDDFIPQSGRSARLQARWCAAADGVQARCAESGAGVHDLLSEEYSCNERGPMSWLQNKFEKNFMISTVEEALLRTSERGF